MTKHQLQRPALLLGVTVQASARDAHSVNTHSCPFTSPEVLTGRLTAAVEKQNRERKKKTDLWGGNEVTQSYLVFEARRKNVALERTFTKHKIPDEFP